MVRFHHSPLVINFGSKNEVLEALARYKNKVLEALTRYKNKVLEALTRYKNEVDGYYTIA